MKKRSIILVVVLFLNVLVSEINLLPQRVQADLNKLEIASEDDTYLVNTSPNANYGHDHSLYLGRSSGDYRETWLRFDLSEIPRDEPMKSATLKLSRKRTFGTAAKIIVQVNSTSVDWNSGSPGLGSETTLTWANKPSYTTNQTASSFTGDKFSATDTDTRISINVTEVVSQSETVDQKLSLALRTPIQSDTNSYIELYSKEEGTYIPYLELVFSSEGTEPNSQVAVLVDKSVPKQTTYEYYVFGVGKWLEWWKMDFNEIDVSITPITRSLLNEYKVIVIPQFQFAVNGNLDSLELQAICQAVYEDGVGLVQIDAYLQGYGSIWSDYVKMFNVTLNNWVSTTTKLNLVIVNSTHFITEIYRNGTRMSRLFPDDGSDWKESDLVFENVTAGTDARTLAVMPYNGKNYPATVARIFGHGQVVLSTFSTGRTSLGYGGYDGFGERANAKTTSGMHGLLWRSIVWAARKPFAFLGMPPFLTFRIDDVAFETHDLYYVDSLLQHGFFVNLYIFQNDALEGGTAYLDQLEDFYLEGSTHIGPHAWDFNNEIYWNKKSNTEYPNSTLAEYFAWLDANYTAWGITPSALVIAHEYQMGANAISFLKEREWVFLSSIYKIPFSAGLMSDCWIWDADWKRIAHLDYADDSKQIFCVAVEMPVGDPTYATQDSFQSATGNNAKAASQVMSSFEHGLADLFWAEAFTHEQIIDNFNSDDLDAILTWVAGNITAQYPFTVKASKEYIARYAYDRRQLSISYQSYAANTLTLNFSGTSTLPVAFYLFTDQKIANYSETLDYFRSYGDDGYILWLPPFSTNHQVQITLGENETNLPHLIYTTANVTSTYSSINSTASRLTVSAKPVWNHDKPLYEFKVNSTKSGPPRFVTYSNGTLISYVYDGATRTVSFNATLSEMSSEITLTWTNLHSFSKAYGSDPSKTNWNPDYDFNDDNEIDIIDLFELGKNYGGNA